MDQEEERLQAFFKRKFSGRDLIMLMDEAGIGVGATVALVKQVELRKLRRPEIYRAFDYPAEGESSFANAQLQVQPDKRYEGYILGACPNCGRRRLELWVDGPEMRTRGDDDDVVECRAVAIRCEKCRMHWFLDPTKGEYRLAHDTRNPLHRDYHNSPPWPTSWPTL